MRGLEVCKGREGATEDDENLKWLRKRSLECRVFEVTGRGENTVMEKMRKKDNL